MSLTLNSCVYEQFEIEEIPSSSLTEKLQAFYVSSPPKTLSSSYWATANYTIVELENIDINNVNNENGVLNTNGMFDGLDDFRADTIELILKAAYDNENLYLLASWYDERYDASKKNWLFNGPADDLKPNDSSNGWTSQRNDDNLIFDFPINDGSNDVWKWSMALSEPLGYALDMIQNGNNLLIDAGDKIYERNILNPSDNNSGPKYEWDGEAQEVDREFGTKAILDPGFYLLNTVEFSGDVVQGDMVYQATCARCHGPEADGEGFENPTGVKLNRPGITNRIARNSFDDRLGGSHSGSGDWNSLNTDEKTNLIARLRSFAGVPGYILDNVTGTFPDVYSVSNVIAGRIETRNESKYQVLLIRPLQTGKDDDIQFNPTTKREYDFSVFLTDNDDENRIGSITEKLVFKQKN